MGLAVKFESFIGLATELFIGGKFESNLSFPPSVTMNVGWEVEYGWTGKYSATQGSDVTLCGDFAQEARDSIQLSVDPQDPSKWENWAENRAPRLFPVLAGLLGGIPSLVASGVEVGREISGVDDMRAGSIAAVHTSQGLSSLMYLMGVVNALTDIKTRKKVVDNPKASLFMDKDKIELKCGKAGLSIFTDGGVLLHGTRFTFVHDAGMAYDPSVTIDKDGIELHKGNIEIQSGKLISESDVETKSGQLKSQTFASPPMVPSVPSDAIGKIKGKRKFGPVISKALRELRKHGPFETI